MAGLTLGLTIDDAQVRQLFNVAPDAVRGRLRSLIEAGAIDVQRELTIEAPVGVGGASGLRGSMRYVLDLTNFRATVRPTIKYAEAVEEGTRPHWVSAKPGSSLAQWARLKGLNPYAVQRSIARKGTKANPFVGPTYRKMTPIVQRNVAMGMSQLAMELNNGRV